MAAAAGAFGPCSFSTRCRLPHVHHELSFLHMSADFLGGAPAWRSGRIDYRRPTLRVACRVILPAFAARPMKCTTATGIRRFGSALGRGAWKPASRSTERSVQMSSRRQITEQARLSNPRWFRRGVRSRSVSVCRRTAMRGCARPATGVLPSPGPWPVLRRAMTGMISRARRSRRYFSWS